MNLKVYLASINMTSRDFCKLIGYNETYFSCVLRGHKKPGKALRAIIEDLTAGEVNINEISMRNEVKKTTQPEQLSLPI